MLDGFQGSSGGDAQSGSTVEESCGAG